jgi:hypothetical protein
VPPFVGQNDPPCLPSVGPEGGCYQLGFTQRGFIRQYLASPVSDALPPTFEMKKVPGHTPSIQLWPQRSGGRCFDCLFTMLLNGWSTFRFFMQMGKAPTGMLLGPPTFETAQGDARAVCYVNTLMAPSYRFG